MNSQLDPATWAHVRQAYLAGVSAPALARIWGVSAQSIYRRAGTRGMHRLAERKSADALDVAGDPGAAAAALGRSALMAIGPALAEGRASDAKALGALAEQMRKLAGAERALCPRDVKDAPFEPDVFIAERWSYIAEVAAVMLNNPAAAPAVFEDMIAAWRREHLGESEEEARARAMADAAPGLRAFTPGFGAAPEDADDAKA